jgi:DHA1 family solute carrier family 18 vesicular amine transporter 1/2
LVSSYKKSFISVVFLFSSDYVRTIGLGMLADTFPVEKLGAVMGTVITSHTVGFLVGPISAGFLYEYGGELAPFYFCTVFGLLTLIGTAFIEEPISRQQPRETCEESDSTAIVADSKIACHQDSNSSDTAFWILLKNRQVIACIVCCFVTSAALAGVEPALSIHFREMYHASPSVIGGIIVLLKYDTLR